MFGIKKVFCDMKFRPCIDLHCGKVKQIVGSTLLDRNDEKLVTNFESEHSSVFYAELYKSDDLYGGHVIMLGQGNVLAAKEALRAFSGGFQVGGGITPDNAKEYLDAGASHIIVTSYVFTNGHISWDNLDSLYRIIPKERIVLDVSCRKKGSEYFVVTNRWQKFTNVIINANNIERLSSYCDEFLVHAVDVEGKQSGIDTDLVGLLEKYSEIPVTYAGGIRSVDDLDAIDVSGCGRIDATVGSALDIFGGKLKYNEVVKWHNNHNQLPQ